MSKELADLEKKYVEFHRTHPIMATDYSGRTLAAHRLDEWDRASNEAQIRAVQVEAKLALGRKLSRDGVDAGAVLQALNQLGTAPADYRTLASESQSDLGTGYLGQLVEEQQQLAERFGPHYARVKAIQDQVTRVVDRSREARNKYQGAAVRDLLTALDQARRRSR